MRWILISLSAVLGLTWSQPAKAWGDTGHRLVCEIAYQRLTAPARQAVQALLAANPAIHAVNPLATEFQWACTYPDHPGAGGPGRRSAEHYVNYARSLATVRATSRCGVAQQCILTAITSDLALLRSATGSPETRAWALVYLGHWYGDIHQPLHSSYADDEGGNKIDSVGLCRSSLHSTWDTCMLQSRFFPSVGRGNPPGVDALRSLASVWNAQIDAAAGASWLRSAPWQWSAESYRVTRNPRTGYCFRGAGGCRYSPSQLTWLPGQGQRDQAIDEAYVQWATPIIEDRIKRAGVRLADALNAALDPDYRS